MTTAKSPPVARIVAILSFFLEHPDQAFTLTQVVRSLHISRATTHTILLGLADAGFLYRRPDKSYLLGPVLHSLAAGAQRYFTPLSIANLEMRAMADELDIVASALFAEGDEVVVRERAASVKHLGWGNTTSRHYPFLPAGAVFLLPLPKEEIAAKVDNAKPALSAQDKQSVYNQLEFGRRYGFIVGIWGKSISGEADLSNLRNYPAYLEGTLGGPTVTNYPVSLTDGAKYHVSFMIAPVMGAMGEVVLALSLQGLPQPLTAEEVMTMGRRLGEACQRVTNFITGKRGDTAA